MGTSPFHRAEEQENVLDPLQNKRLPQLMMSPREVICSFCGVATHGHRDCPVMHQYIREQADMLAQQRMGEYHQLQDWARYESPRQALFRQEPLWRGGHQEKESVSNQRPERQKTQRQRAQVKTGIVGSMYPHVVRGMAPGGGGEDPLPLGKRGPPDDKSEEDSEEEEDDESDIDMI